MKKIHFDMNIIMVSYIIGKKQLICKLFFSYAACENALQE